MFFFFFLYLPFAFEIYTATTKLTIIVYTVNTSVNQSNCSTEARKRVISRPETSNDRFFFFFDLFAHDRTTMRTHLRTRPCILCTTVDTKTGLQGVPPRCTHSYNVSCVDRDNQILGFFIFFFRTRGAKIINCTSVY